MSEDIDQEYLTMATMEGMRESACYLAIKDLIELYGAGRCRAFIAEALNELDPPNAPREVGPVEGDPVFDLNTGQFIGTVEWNLTKKEQE